jgi:hypothetical protein
MNGVEFSRQTAIEEPCLPVNDAKQSRNAIGSGA